MPKKKKSKSNYSNVEPRYHEDWVNNSELRYPYRPWQPDYHFPQEHYHFQQEPRASSHNWVSWRDGLRDELNWPPEFHQSRRTLLPDPSRNTTNHSWLPRQPILPSYDNYRYDRHIEYDRPSFQHHLAGTSREYLYRPPNPNADRESLARSPVSYPQHFRMHEFERVETNRFNTNQYTAKLRSSSLPVAKVMPVMFTSVPVCVTSSEKLPTSSVATAKNVTPAPITAVSFRTISRGIVETTKSFHFSGMTSRTSASFPVANAINVSSLPLATVSSVTSTMTKVIAESTTSASTDVPKLSSATTASPTIASTLPATSAVPVATVTPVQSVSLAILPVQSTTTRNEIGRNDSHNEVLTGSSYTSECKNSADFKKVPVVTVFAAVVEKQPSSNNKCKTALNAKKCSSEDEIDVEYLYTVKPDNGKLIEVLDLSDIDKGSEEISLNRNLILSTRDPSSNKHLGVSNMVNKPATGKARSLKRKRETTSTHCVVCEGEYEGIVCSDDGNLLFSSKCGHLFCMSCLKNLVPYKCTECNGAIANLRKVVK